MMLEKSLADYAAALASKDPVPGGGGAAAYVAALGVSLGAMVCNLTLGKRRYAGAQDEIAELEVRCRTLRDEFERLSEADAEVFYPLSQAYGLPSGTPDERDVKAAVLQPALVAAAEVPLQVCRRIGGALDILDRLSEIGSRIAISDVGVGASFCQAALTSAELNVLINSRLLTDPAHRQALEAEAARLTTEGVAHADRIVAKVRAQLAG
jgi:formiminotetrahydrofolate cyclodeaminase